MAKELTPRQLQFVNAYLKNGGNGAAAAVEAGYSKGNSRHRAYELLNENEAVKKAIDEARTKLREATQYTAEKAMAAADDAFLMAELTKNAMAMVKATELKAKLCGLLIERHDVRTIGKFQINIQGLDGKDKKDDSNG